MARDTARRDRAAGVDLVQARKLAKLKNVVTEDATFRATALKWYGKNKARWSNHYAIREERNLEKGLFPYFAERRISEIRPIESALNNPQPLVAVEDFRVYPERDLQGCAL